MNQNTPSKKSFWSERGQIATASFAVWALLAAWSIAAFYSHIDRLNSDYVFMAKVGAIASEVILLAFTAWHVFHIKLRVRLWSLIFAFVLGAAILFHAGALQSMNAARTEQNEKNAGLVENIAKLNKESVVSVNPSRQATQRERLNIAGKEAAAQADALKNAQGLIIEQANKSEEKVKDSTLLSHDYLNKHLFTALFVLSLTLFSILLAIMMFAPGKTDADYDGIADQDQYAQFQQPTMQTPGVQPMTARSGSATSQPTIQRPSFARRVFNGESASPVQTAAPSTDSKSADWPSDNGKDKRSH